ncbi:MAG: carbohydrate ABC transporter permease [Clostridiaceae bacterium]|nr:carbohydrate ABC transporter permease [Clostridiaceae bacterium]
MMSPVAKKIVLKIITYLLAILIVIFALVPFLWAVSTSFKTNIDIYSLKPSFIPKPFILSNYTMVLENPKMVTYFRNTVIIAICSTIISLFVAVFAAYGFSRYKFPGRSPLLYSILFTRVLPRVALLVPFYVTLSNLQLVNKISGLVLVYLIVGMPITVWLLKGYIDALPAEVEEAALVDGCRPLQILFRIVVPMVAPAIAAIGMYSFILAWNEFLFPLLLAKDSTTRPISVGLAFYIDEDGIDWGPMMAASVLMSLPAIILFSFAQKYIVKGLSEGAVKG